MIGMLEWWIVGTGAHARKVAQAVLAARQAVVGFADEDPRARSPLEGVPVRKVENLPPPTTGTAVFVAIGRADVRRRLMERLALAGWALPAVVHPRAWVAPDAHLHEGVFVAAQAAVESASVLGRGSIVDSGAVVDHDAALADFSHLGPGQVLAVGLRLEAGP
jgi:hypothetical protein